MDAGSYDLSVSNEELLRRCREQDQDALQVLFRRHERPVYGLLYRMLGNREDAEEALAEVFVTVWRAAAKFRGDAKFTTWLYHIAANAARDVLRSRRSQQTVSLDDLTEWESEALMSASDPGEDPSEAVVRAEERAVIMSYLQKLSPDDRLLITLYHIQEASYEEISQITGIPPANLKVRLFRARQRLRDHCETLAEWNDRSGSDAEKEGQENGLRADSAESAGVQPPVVEMQGQ